MFTDEAHKLFKLDDIACAQDFSVLQHAYVNVRYKDIYQAGGVNRESVSPFCCFKHTLTAV